MDGDIGIVESIVVVEDANQPMYNLTVDEAHTFFIGDGEWLVHNTCKIRRVDWDDTGLSAFARAYRRNNPNYSPGTNIVVYRYIVGNRTEIKAFPMRPNRNQQDGNDWTFHAEQYGWAQLEV